MRPAGSLTALGDRTFRSLRRHRNYRLYFAGSGISFIGTWMQQIAAYWLVLDLTHSPVAVGALALAQTLPVTAMALVGGSIADRVDLRRMVVTCETVLGLQAAALCVLALTGAVAAWQLYVLGFVQGIALALDSPARHTLVFQIVGRDDLTNAVALSSSMGTTARIIGPALGGVVVASAGPGVAFGLNAVSYAIVISAVLAMRLPPRPPRTGPLPGVLAGVGEALGFAVSSRRVAVTFFTVLLVSTFSFNFDVLLPLVARLTLDEGARTFGLIASVFGCGALCGALILAAVGRARMLFVLGGALGFGGFQLLLAPQDTLLTVCALLFLTGICYVLWGSSALATLQLAAPEHLRGRAASLYFFAFMGGAPIGGLIAGSLTAHGGTRLAFAFAGTMALLVVAAGATVLLDGPPARDRTTVDPGGRSMTAVEQTFSTTHCAFGVARRDVTPPVGIYARSWGAATHDVAEGVHRPLTATAAVFAPLAGEGPTLALVALDIGWFQYAPDGLALRAAIMERTGLGEAELLVQMSHTHAGANTNSRLEGLPGTELIAPYLEHLTAQVGDAVLDAQSTATEAFVTYGHGRCGLATNRDFRDAVAERYACGYNPDGAADDTLMVARATDRTGRTLATLFNYACHPTTLAWENRLLSPDYVGAAREVLEHAFGAPALFLQGASGELAPRDDYVGDPAVADRNGRQLGHAAAAAIEALPPPGTRFVYTGIVASGANLGTWGYRPCETEQLAAAGSLEAVLTGVDLARKEDLGVVESVSSATPDSPQEREKAMRREFLRLALGDEPVNRMPIWAWRLGEALLLAVPNEPYSVFQVELRRRFAGTPLLVLMTTNGGVGYLPPRETYGSGRYQEQQSPYAPGCLEEAIDAAAEALEPLRSR